MQKRSALHEPERSGARQSQCVMDSGMQSENRPSGAHEVNPDLETLKFGCL